jgi:SAM-dependent methyltransferase
MNFLNIIKYNLRKKGKISFLLNQDENCSILDVGCGNNSPYLIKSILPNCKYTGIDVGDYNQKKLNLADKYILTTPVNFPKSILSLGCKFDVIISSHNLEHCDDRSATLLAMLKVLKPGGSLYISFPSERTTNFPKRKGTLNYYDDETHRDLPPNFNELVEQIISNDFKIEFSVKSYQPTLLRIIGFAFEPLSRIKNTVFLGTWEFYGFESIIWAKKVIKNN